jgi:hypothetical protein
MDTIAIAPLHRPGGSNWHERRSFDFVVNGISLFEMTGGKKHDMCGRFSVDNPDWNRSSLKAFVLEGDPDDGLPDGQFMIFVCPECADLGCGAIICTIERLPDGFTWRDFAYDNGYGDDMPDYKSYSHVGPFHFPDVEYRQVIAEAANAQQDGTSNGG